MAKALRENQELGALEWILKRSSALEAIIVVVPARYAVSLN